MSVIEMTRTLAGHTGAVNSVAFSPDGALIATASEDTTAKVWDVATGETVHTLRGHSEPVFAAAFSPSHAIVVTVSADDTPRHHR